MCVGSGFASAATGIFRRGFAALLAARRLAGGSAFLTSFFLRSYFLAALFFVFALAAVFAFMGSGCTSQRERSGSEEDEFLHGGWLVD